MDRAPDPRPWPALMDLATASEYLSLSPGTLVAYLQRHGVQRVDLGARLRRWRKEDLDQLISRTPAIGSPAVRCVLAKAGEDAIAAVERRTFARVRQRRRSIQ